MKKLPFANVLRGTLSTYAISEHGKVKIPEGIVIKCFPERVAYITIAEDCIRLYYKQPPVEHTVAAIDAEGFLSVNPEYLMQAGLHGEACIVGHGRAEDYAEIMSPERLSRITKEIENMLLRYKEKQPISIVRFWKMLADYDHL